MRQSTFKDLRTTSVAIVIAILASATGIYGIGVSPVHAAFSTPFSIFNAPPIFHITSFAAMGSGITYITVRQLDSDGKLLGIKSTPFPCTNPVCPPARGRSPAVTPDIPYAPGLAKLHLEAGSSDPNHSSLVDVQDAVCNATPNCTLIGSPQSLTLSPGSGQLLIHEYTSTDLEMNAFQAGSIDMVDWPVPQSYLSTWNTCSSAFPIGPNCKENVTTNKYAALDMFQIDMNENGSRVASQLSFRQAMGYLVDRQNICLGEAGGFCCPIVSGASCSQEGSASPQSLGYPGPYGDYNPTKALQLLYEDGWRYDSDNGFMYGPALTGGVPLTPCSSTIPGQTVNFCVRTITFLIRSDDPLRLGAGQAMANTMQNLPNEFCSKAGGNINPIPPCPAGSTLTTVCPSAPCKLDVTLNVAAKPALAKIFQHAPWNTWDLYTGGWNVDLLAAEDLPFLYTSGFAPVADCGSWVGDFPLNYGGFCNTAFDNAAQAILTASTISQADAAAVTAQRVAWGYSASQGKITGAEPTVPMYTHLAYKAGWLRDMVGGLCVYGSAIGSTGCPSPAYAERACRQGFISNEVGTGLDNYEAMVSMFDDNCYDNTANHVSYLGNPNATLDWGFINPIQFLSIMQSTFTWDVQAMQFTYDTMLGRNPANPSELIPFLCSDYSVGTYFNTHTSGSATYYACHMRSDLVWSDGVPLTAQDIAFSTDYVAENQAPLYASNVANLCGPNFTTTPFYSPTNCGNGVQIVNDPDGTQKILFYFDSISAIFPLLVSLGNPIIPQHVYCNSWTGPAAGQLGPGVKATANCLFPDMSLLPDTAGLSDGSCTDCPVFPGSYPDGTAVPIPPYLTSLGYGPTGATNCLPNGFSPCIIHNWQTGSGPYMISSCGGAGCANTILLKANPYWHDGIRMASPATGDIADPSGLHGGLELQPDLNRDESVNATDLAIAQTQAALAANAADWRFSAALRQSPTGTETITVSTSVCGVGCTTPTIVASFTGWPGTQTDVYIIQKLDQEGTRLGLSNGITWPPPSGSVTNKFMSLPPNIPQPTNCNPNPYGGTDCVGSLTYIWPDSSGLSGEPDDTVNVNDLIYVFNHQFVPVTDPSGNLITTSPYNADVTHDGVIDIHDLVTTLARQFTQPCGVEQ